MCKAKRIISSSILVNDESDGKTNSWLLSNASLSFGWMIEYQCAFFEVMQRKKSARPCLPIFLDDGMVTYVTAGAVVSWAVTQVVKYRQSFVVVFTMMLLLLMIVYCMFSRGRNFKIHWGGDAFQQVGPSLVHSRTLYGSWGGRNRCVCEQGGAAAR